MTTAKKTTAREDVKALEAAVETGKQTVEAFVKAGADAQQKALEQTLTLSKEQIEKAQTAFFKSYNELHVFGKDNVEALFRASSIAVKGAEEISRAVVAFAQAQIESQVSATKAILGCTSLRQVVDVQTDLAKTSFDKVVAEGSKFSELATKVANEAMEPIQARVNVAVEKFMKPAA
ncbi:MAG: phasin family protein [Alphaproteobacteria bacterium]|nr:phasin family protein [Alphaproteobacteria bacterium]TAD87134.1 MAG: phasin family protein [Alphaproteobacteria bacterium]